MINGCLMLPKAPTSKRFPTKVGIASKTPESWLLNPPFQQLQIRQLLRLHFKHNIVFHDSCGIQSWYYVITTSQVYNCALKHVTAAMVTTLAASLLCRARCNNWRARCHCAAFSQVPGDAMNIGGMGWHWDTCPLCLPWFNATLRRITEMLREMRVSHGFLSKFP